MTSLLILVGPTGVGKTATAIELGERLNGEIISADSMQIYRGLDIGTAKASAEELARVRHHLIDIREPSETYSAAQWAADARDAIADIRSRKKTPVVAGGTGFYLRALLEPDSLAGAPPDEELRTRLENEATEQGVEQLHARLAELDPAAAARLHPNDVRRVVRAMEVALSSTIHTSSAAPTEANEAMTKEENFEPHVVGLTMPRELLYSRLEARIYAMLAAGFMDEMRHLVETAPADCIALQGVGYRQMRPALENPALFDEGVELWKRDTRRYAKRQMTWFRHQLPTQWLDVTEFSGPQAIAEYIAAHRP